MSQRYDTTETWCPTCRRHVTLATCSYKADIDATANLVDGEWEIDTDTLCEQGTEDETYSCAKCGAELEDGPDGE